MQNKCRTNKIQLYLCRFLTKGAIHVSTKLCELFAGSVIAGYAIQYIQIQLRENCVLCLFNFL